MIDSGQHLHHELGVQQYTVARFPPELLLLPGEATHTQPEEGAHTCRVTSVQMNKKNQVTAGPTKQRFVNPKFPLTPAERSTDNGEKNN